MGFRQEASKALKLRELFFIHSNAHHFTLKTAVVNNSVS